MSTPQLASVIVSFSPLMLTETGSDRVCVSGQRRELVVSDNLWSLLVLPVLLKVLLLVNTVATRVFMSHLSGFSAGRCRLIELWAAGTLPESLLIDSPRRGECARVTRSSS